VEELPFWVIELVAKNRSEFTLESSTVDLSVNNQKVTDLVQEVW
jgi:hypothetical protein